jgi:ubiquitin-like-conjugating enzyme ATG3
MSSLLGSFRTAREWATPTLKQSAFLDKGVLTPEEFVIAGDELVYKCPTWAWEAGDDSKRKSYLPPDKQYLVTRNVPCQTRVSSMESEMVMEGGDDDWMVSSIIKRSENLSLEDEFDILDEEGEVIEKPEPTEPETEDDEYADMDAFEDDNILQDDDAVAAVKPDEDHTVKVRTYDLSITYDKYYQTPRVWMIGRNTQDQPLTADEMMQDVISDYANKTVTMESHPHVAGPQASIHPCQHGKVMKAIVRNLIKSTEGGESTNGPSVEMYIFIFLKFVR